MRSYNQLFCVAHWGTLHSITIHGQYLLYIHKIPFSFPQSKPFDSENGELVELVALYRKHIEAQQVDHSHTKNVRISLTGSL